MPPNPTVLAFDTSAAHCAAALLCNGQIVAARYEEMAKGQAERLLPLLNEVLVEAGMGWGNLDALGVGIGPGNFTGIRISVAAARGLALSLAVPAIGISAFEVLHRCFAEPDEAQHLAVLAQRGGFYLQPLSHGTPAEIAFPWTNGDSPPSLKWAMGAPVTLLGEGAKDMARMFPSSVTLRQATLPLPQMAQQIAQIAAGRVGRPQPRPAPLYVRAPDAAPPRDPAPVILP